MLSKSIIKLLRIICVTPCRGYIGDVIKLCNNVC